MAETTGKIVEIQLSGPNQDSRNKMTVGSTTAFVSTQVFGDLQKVFGPLDRAIGATVKFDTEVVSGNDWFQYIKITK